MLLGVFIIKVTVSDRPGGIAELCALIAKEGASIKDIFHERAWLKTDVFSVKVRVVLETNDNEHVHRLYEAIKGHYGDIGHVRILDRE